MDTHEIEDHAHSELTAGAWCNELIEAGDDITDVYLCSYQKPAKEQD